MHFGANHIEPAAIFDGRCSFWLVAKKRITLSNLDNDMISFVIKQNEKKHSLACNHRVFVTPPGDVK